MKTAYTIAKIVGYATLFAIGLILAPIVSSKVLVLIIVLLVVMAISNYIEGNLRDEIR